MTHMSQPDRSDQGTGDRAILASRDDNAALNRNGYVALSLLRPDQVTSLLDDVQQLRPHDRFAPDGTSFARNDYHCTFLDDDLDYRRQVQSLLAQYFEPVLAQIAPDFRILTANLYVKQPGKGDFPVHQNWPVLADLGATSITLWCALVDCDAQMGTLHVVPGSHKLLPHVEGPGSPAYFTPMMSDIAHHLFALPAKAGEGFVFDDSLVHGSPSNSGTQPRIAVQIACVPKASQPIFFYRCDEARFECIKADTQFYYENRLSDLLVRNPDWESLGFVANRNQMITEPEFVRLLKDPEFVRQCWARPHDDPEQNGEGTGLAARIACALDQLLGRRNRQRS